MTLHTEEDIIASQAGFTLLETMVVLVIAGLLMGVGLERGPLRSDTATFSAVRSRVLSIFRDAQALSEMSGDSVNVDVDATTAAFLTQHGKTMHDQKISGPVRLLLPQPGGRFALHASYHFTADGSVLGPPVLLMLGKHACIISFSPVTGRISVHEG